MPFFKLVDIYHDGDVEGWKKWKGENKISGVGANFEAKVRARSAVKRGRGAKRRVGVEARRKAASWGG